MRKALNAAQTGRPILGIDGCALACVRSSLAQRGIEPTMHLQLGEHGVRKEYHADFSEAQADSLYEHLKRRIEAMTVWMR